MPFLYLADAGRVALLFYDRRHQKVEHLSCCRSVSPFAIGVLLQMLLRGECGSNNSAMCAIGGSGRAIASSSLYLFGMRARICRARGARRPLSGQTITGMPTMPDAPFSASQSHSDHVFASCYGKYTPFRRRRRYTARHAHRMPPPRRLPAARTKAANSLNASPPRFVEDRAEARCAPFLTRLRQRADLRRRRRRVGNGATCRTRAVSKFGAQAAANAVHRAKHWSRRPGQNAARLSRPDVSQQAGVSLRALT